MPPPHNHFCGVSATSSRLTGLPTTLNVTPRFGAMQSGGVKGIAISIQVGPVEDSSDQVMGRPSKIPSSVTVKREGSS